MSQLRVLILSVDIQYFFNEIGPIITDFGVGLAGKYFNGEFDDDESWLADNHLMVSFILFLMEAIMFFSSILESFKHEEKK